MSGAALGTLVALTSASPSPEPCPVLQLFDFCSTSAQPCFACLDMRSSGPGRKVSLALLAP